MLENSDVMGHHARAVATSIQKGLIRLLQSLEIILKTTAVQQILDTFHIQIQIGNLLPDPPGEL